MTPVDTSERLANFRETEPKRPAGRRWILLAVVAIPVLAIIYIAIVALNWPFKEQALIDVLQERSVRSVTIARFYRTYFPPGCVAEGINFLHRKHKNKPPLIMIQKLELQTSYARLFTFQQELSRVRATGMHVTVPPRSPDGGPNPVMPLTHGQPGSKMKIGTVIADGAVLDFLSGDPGKQPYRITIEKLAIDGVGNDTALSYKAVLTNMKPPGEIRSKGQFGPWNPDDPARTPVKGDYTFENANLGVFSGISGRLFSKGSFQGMLDHIEAVGTVNVPQFHVTGSGHSRQLTAQFHAAVDGTNGNTSLENVTAHFDNTTVTARGMVSGAKGEKGKIVRVDIASTGGRIEDLLKLFIEAKRAPMTGNISFQAHVEVPPEAEQFVQKVKLDGAFGVGGGKFTSTETQGSIDKLSASAKKAEKVKQQEDPETVLDNLTGKVVLRDGTASCSNLAFNVPGANAKLHGTYSLIDYKVDLHGTLITTGNVSNGTSGFKSLLVKAITPLFKRKAKAKIVPFRITGTYGNTSVALDLGKIR